jgi:hypothetical protein
MSIHYIGYRKEGELIAALEKWILALREGRPVRIMAIADMGDGTIDVTTGTFPCVDVAGWAHYLSYRAFRDSDLGGVS